MQGGLRLLGDQSIPDRTGRINENSCLFFPDSMYSSKIAVDFEYLRSGVSPSALWIERRANCDEKISFQRKIKDSFVLSTILIL